MNQMEDISRLQDMSEKEITVEKESITLKDLNKNLTDQPNLAQKLYKSTVLELNNVTEILSLQKCVNRKLDTRMMDMIQILFFEKLKLLRMNKKINVIDRLEGSLIDANNQIHSLEQCMGDWTQMVKGINGASGGITFGVKG